MMTAKSSRIVILTALPVEYKAVRAHLSDLREEIHAQGTVYEIGRFRSEDKFVEVTLCEIGAGNETAALETERAIQHFKPELILFVGVAGGIKDVQLDDVVAATKIYQYESGKEKGEFQPRPDAPNSSYKLVQRARAAARTEGWHQRLRHSLPTSSRAPSVFVGPIAAGEKVLASTRASVYRFIKRQYGDALAVEMEGHGFLKAAYANENVQAIVIRGISDLVSGKKAADDAVHQEIAARNASAFAFEIIDKMVFAGVEAANASDLQPPSDSAVFYELVLSDDELQRLGVLYTWRFLELPIPQPIGAANNILETGTRTTTTFHLAPPPAITDCSVECELRIIDDGDDPGNRWAGFRVRGFHDDIRFGYLIYMRATGTVELYCAGDVLGGANDRIVVDTSAAWTLIRVVIVNGNIQVWVNRNLHIQVTDRTYEAKGQVFLHTFGTRAQFRHLKVQELQP